jgi:hypothetical protein
VMKKIIISKARNQIAKLINTVRETGDIFAIGRRHLPEVLQIKFPTHYNLAVDDITNINLYSESFSFLNKEPELYSISDLK